MKVFTWLIIHSLIYLLRLIHDTYRLHWVFEYGRKSLLKPQTEKKNCVSQSAFRGVLIYLLGQINFAYDLWHASEHVIFECKTTRNKNCQSKCVQKRFDIFARAKYCLIYLLGQNIFSYGTQFCMLEHSMQDMYHELAGTNISKRLWTHFDWPNFFFVVLHA